MLSELEGCPTCKVEAMFFAAGCRYMHGSKQYCFFLEAHNQCPCADYCCNNIIDVAIWRKLPHSKNLKITANTSFFAYHLHAKSYLCQALFLNDRCTCALGLQYEATTGVFYV